MSVVWTGEGAATKVAALSVGGVALTYVLAVRTRAGQLVDTQAMLAIAHVLAGPAWAQQVLDLVSPPTVLLAGIALASLAGMLRGRGAAVTALATIAGTAVGAVVLKALLTRPHLLDAAGNSLPSGHVAAVAGLATAATLVSMARHRVLVLAVGLFAVGLTGLSTVALQWHRPSDVLASILLAVGVAAGTSCAMSTLSDWYVPTQTQVTHR